MKLEAPFACYDVQRGANHDKEMFDIFFEEMKRREVEQRETQRATYNREDNMDIAVEPLQNIPDNLQDKMYETGKARDWELLSFAIQNEYGKFIDNVENYDLKTNPERREERQNLARFQAKQARLVDRLMLAPYRNGNDNGNGMYHGRRTPGRMYVTRPRRDVTGNGSYFTKMFNRTKLDTRATAIAMQRAAQAYKEELEWKHDPVRLRQEKQENDERMHNEFMASLENFKY